MNNKFKKIISSLILVLMVILTPVEVFAQERNTANEPAKQEIKESSERSSRHKRSINDIDEDGQEERINGNMYGGGGGGGGVPRNAYTVAEKVISNNGKAPYGYVGGDVYKNKGLKLPTNTTYREYDVNPYSHGQNRGSERIVIGGNGSVWYTSDHYSTFIQMK